MMTQASVRLAVLLACAFQPVAPLAPPARRTGSRASRSVHRATTLPELSIPNPFLSNDARRSRLKVEILALASETERGLTETDRQRDEMRLLFERLERLNPTPDPLVVDDRKASVNGDWSLEYTTSGSILGRGGAPRVGPIVQSIDTTTLSARNSEVVRYASLLDVPRSVTAELSPLDGRFTNVKFKRFTLGPIGFDAPNSFVGALDVTYLDDDVRLTRGDKGNLFVLTRM